MNLSDKLKIFWGTLVNPELIGNLYGYRVHNETLSKFVKYRDDVELVNSVDEADCLLYITTPEVFEVKHEKPIFLFTMFEGTNLPDVYIQNIRKADYLITPTTWVKELFSKHFPPERIFVVPHGVEEDFEFVNRKRNPKVFRFFWIGAPNPRKGYQELIFTWSKLNLDSDPTIELYFKTTRVPNWDVKRNKNVILDSRDLSKKELIGLYHQAHCFVWPTRGEGFGLPLAEAMATGLPCIATGYSGVTEFFDEEVGYPIRYTMGQADMNSPRLGYMGKVEVAQPDVVDLAKKMLHVRRNYRDALAVGRRASFRMKSEFIWENSAERLINSFRIGISGGKYSGLLHEGSGKVVSGT
jgi:glycosyltransferase involved in cell wall biosynthesis